MRNISYFCIVKHLIYLFRYIFVLALVLSSAKTNAQTDSTILKSMDSVQISLLTCGPGTNVYSLYGHTAVRYHDLGRNQDVAVNYGMFSFQKDHFILRFVFGLTDYEMGIEDFTSFITEYGSRGRWVNEQILNLSREEKWAITQAIDINYRPENRVYRYNYFYDNCSTRARDLITDHIQGNVLYPENKNITSSYREMIHQWTINDRWSRFGNDLLLGVKADSKTNNSQQQFLPDSLRANFEHAIVITHNGQRHPLVASSHYLVAKTSQNTSSYTTTPMECMLLLFVATLLICLAEWRTKHIFWGYDLILLLITGLAGIILTAMIFSQHPTVSLNFQILLLSPLSLIFLYPTVKQLRKRKIHSYLKLWALLLCLFLALSFFQHYAEGMIILALSLLIRYGWLMFFSQKLTKQT